MDHLAKLTTESNNPATNNLDCMSSLEIVKIMNAEDMGTIAGVKEQIGNIAKGIDYIEQAFRKGGRLFYLGCGTSGRLGVLDASECPPTFGTPPEMVVGIIAGGDTALRNAVEGAEDSFQAGEKALIGHNVDSNDVVVGISASGRSPYVMGALCKAKQLGATTIGVCNNHNCEMQGNNDLLIAAEVGAEIIQGSTRLKAGTAQKMILNMLTTGSMIRIGKVYRNLMVDMCPSNKKLFGRAIRLVCVATECGETEAEAALSACNYHVKTAILMVMLHCDAKKSKELLLENHGYIRKALEHGEKEG
ncbi:MAG: N-acetylmuramic acid 6-phosphate etherase [Oscillospiraceae bacterium]